MGSNALRRCKHCGVEAYNEEDLEKFSPNKDCLHGRALECKPCHNNRRKMYRRANPSSYKDTNMKYLCANSYHITLEEYKERMSTSDCCEICGTKDNLCYDHDHNTMDFRGVLCKKCNKGLGNLGDTLEGVMKAVKYLTKGE